MFLLSKVGTKEKGWEFAHTSNIYGKEGKGVGVWGSGLVGSQSALETLKGLRNSPEAGRLLLHPSWYRCTMGHDSSFIAMCALLRAAPPLKGCGQNDLRLSYFPLRKVKRGQTITLVVVVRMGWWDSSAETNKTTERGYSCSVGTFSWVWLRRGEC